MNEPFADICIAEEFNWYFNIYVSYLTTKLAFQMRDNRLSSSYMFMYSAVSFVDFSWKEAKNMEKTFGAVVSSINTWKDYRYICNGTLYILIWEEFERGCHYENHIATNKDTSYFKIIYHPDKHFYMKFVVKSNIEKIVVNYGLSNEKSFCELF